MARIFSASINPTRLSNDLPVFKVPQLFLKNLPENFSRLSYGARRSYIPFTMMATSVQPHCSKSATHFINTQPSIEVLEIWRNADAVCFDVDSTVCLHEGIDELADFCGAGKAVSEWTNKAMSGSVPFEEALAARLSLFSPSLLQVQDFLNKRPPRLSPGIAELINKLKASNTDVYLISGGFLQMIEPVAVQLEIPRENIFANRLLFGSSGEFLGFDTTEFTSRSGGKAVAVQHIRKVHGYKSLIMIGDGATDLEILLRRGLAILEDKVAYCRINFRSTQLSRVISLYQRNRHNAACGWRMSHDLEKNCKEMESKSSMLLLASDQYIRDSITAIKAGKVIAVPTDTLYGFACDACSAAAINQIYEVKGRKLTSPLAICVADVSDIPRFAVVDALPYGLLDALLPGPVTIVLRRDDSSILEKSLNPGLDSIGVRIPDYNFIRAIARGSGSALALTSANLSGQPSSISPKDFEQLWHHCAYVFDGGSLQSGRAGSTVVDLTEPGSYKILRPGSAREETVAVLHSFNLEEAN